MQEFTDKQLFEALSFARSQDEQSGRNILERFQTQQPAFAQTIFSVFPSTILGLDQAMAHLFMDLCFDVIAVYEQAFGKVPDQRLVGNTWFQEKAALLDQEMKTVGGHAESKTTTHWLDQEHQKGLVNFLHAAIDQQPSDSADAVRLAKTMIFATVQLFDALYDAITVGQNQSAVH